MKYKLKTGRRRKINKNNNGDKMKNNIFDIINDEDTKKSNNLIHDKDSTNKDLLEDFDTSNMGIDDFITRRMRRANENDISIKDTLTNFFNGNYESIASLLAPNLPRTHYKINNFIKDLRYKNLSKMETYNPFVSIFDFSDHDLKILINNIEKIYNDEYINDDYWFTSNIYKDIVAESNNKCLGEMELKTMDNPNTWGELSILFYGKYITTKSAFYYVLHMFCLAKYFYYYS